MLANRVEPDKITSGTYYHALLQCKRLGGAVEAYQDKRKQYFSNKMEDFQNRLSKNEDDEIQSRKNRNSNVSIGLR